MSLEAALEEERLAILELLERPNTKSPPPQLRAYNPSSPLGSRTTSPTRGRVTSLIDIATPNFASVSSPNLSPTRASSTSVTNGLHRHSMPAGPRLLRDRDKPMGYTSHEDYQFSMISSVPAFPSMPKRVTQGAKSQGIRSMIGGIGDDRFGKFAKRSRSPTTNAAMRHAQAQAQRPTSPRPGWQSGSARSSTSRMSSPPPAESRYSITSEDGASVDLQHAYRRLDDNALAASGGILGSLPEKKAVVNSLGEYIRAGSGESLTKEGGIRLQKDYVSGDERAAVDSSEEESTEGESTEGEGKFEDEDGSKRGRSKKRENGGGGSDTEGDAVKKVEGTLSGGGRRISSLLSIGSGSGKKKKGDKKKPMSLLAAADEERKVVSSRYKVHSLLPSISVTQPGSSAPTSPITARRPGVHPSTNFDLPSHASTPMTSETELDLQDIRRAQRMEMVISPITSTPETHRVVRTIVRGDFDALQDEAEQGNRRQRTYLVATDMSGEAAHALEWTIGTVLRDGDTLLAIYAAGEDSVDSSAITPTSATSAVMNGLTVAEGAASSAIAPASPALASISNFAQSAPSSPVVSFSTPPSRNPSPPPSSIGIASRRGSGEKRRGISRDRGSNASAEKSKAELERVVATENITQLVAKLLKKTRLQVRCVVEVIHCKSPKHLLTEMIDYIEPTLVILGSRGRSALKGVLLGSFSNYLVTKSSVPVMVARKKLKQHVTKKKKANSPFAIGTGGNVNVRLTNNLVAGPVGRVGSSLANAKVD
ncbi:hypothetical protein EV426DRAFT_571509 [Tirmania nivea]|nr:hypothetical protein EV426DRAFT_571509 [Tirmania nivea]